jgi:predicted HTH transcriptional regulator
VNDPENDPDRDPENDPDHDTEREVEDVASGVANDRQRWLLAELAHGNRVGQRDLRDHFSVSEKTAKRDIAGLKSKGLIVFTGSCRSGQYALPEEAGNIVPDD